MSLMDKFSSTQYSPYINSINPNSLCIEINNTQGKGSVYVHDVFNGILTLFVDISSKEWPIAGVGGYENIYFLNYCIKGRCEVTLENGMTTCISDGEVSISKSSAIKKFLYPLKQYEGIEFVFAMSEIEQSCEILKGFFGIDLVKMLEHYTSGKLLFTTEMSLKLKLLMKKLWENRSDESSFEMKMNILGILHAFSSLEIVADNKKRFYLTGVQTQIAKAIEAKITKDLEVKITVSELSRQFDISETTLKTYFKNLYGKNISAYLQEVRMNEASRLIEKTTYTIADISGMVGYENQSKFAAVFKTYFNCSPLEYRRLKYFEDKV